MARCACEGRRSGEGGDCTHLGEVEIPIELVILDDKIRAPRHLPAPTSPPPPPPGRHTHKWPATQLHRPHCCEDIGASEDAKGGLGGVGRGEGHADGKERGRAWCAPKGLIKRTQGLI